MIKIIIKTDEDKIIGYNVFGHANFAPKGKDIVCSAVSSITQTALLGLKELLKKDIEFEQDNGLLRVQINNPDKDSNLLLETMFLGLKKIEKIYPKNVLLKFNKV